MSLRALGKAQGCGRLPTLIPSAACNVINEEKRCVMDNKSFWCESSPLPSPRLLYSLARPLLFLFSLLLDRRPGDKIKKETLAVSSYVGLTPTAGKRDAARRLDGNQISQGGQRAVRRRLWVIGLAPVGCREN